MKKAKLLLVVSSMIALAISTSSCTRSRVALAGVNGGGASARDDAGLGDTYHRMETRKSNQRKAEKEAQEQRVKEYQQAQKQQELQKRQTQQGGQAAPPLSDAQKSETTGGGPSGPSSRSHLLPELGNGQNEPSYGYEWRYFGPLVPWLGPGSNSSIPGVNTTSPGSRMFPFATLGRPIVLPPQG